jgi:hypothetical protein
LARTIATAATAATALQSRTFDLLRTGTRGRHDAQAAARVVRVVLIAARKIFRHLFDGSQIMAYISFGWHLDPPLPTSQVSLPDLVSTLLNARCNGIAVRLHG